jgi:hypothetical protein
VKYLFKTTSFFLAFKEMPDVTERKITCDDVLSVLASVITMTCIITYFVYLAMR